MTENRKDHNSPSSVFPAPDLVKEYYSEMGLKEWRRLVIDAYHRLEFGTTLHFLEKYLPRNGLILDVGGGPGRYTIELAKLGYDLVLLDLTPRLLEVARRQRLNQKSNR